uniref:Uncharacterized protein n=1 Tax=Candidatus Kentrum sp. FW TaxID=2126338 RepID=A0A450S9N8_9GAMM|nr:MAG: hypothetical protein BECKFW1821A_GA0114235_102045 [Candidatus Kentron sp. FW]
MGWNVDANGGGNGWCGAVRPEGKDNAGQQETKNGSISRDIDGKERKRPNQATTLFISRLALQISLVLTALWLVQS